MGESHTPKYKLGDKVKVKAKNVPEEELTIYQISCGDGRSEPHYWAHLSKEYEFDESEVKK